MYQEQKSSFGQFEALQLYNPEGASMKIIPAFGANLVQLKLLFKNKTYDLINGVASDQELLNDKAFKSALLAPFPNRIRDGQYQFEQKKFQLPVNEKDKNNALHGFMYKHKFEVEDVKLLENMAEVNLVNQYSGDEEGFPFKFQTSIKFVISDKEGLSVTLQVINTDKKPIPMGLGWHPYFTFQQPVNKLFLQLPQVEQQVLDERCIPTGQVVKYDNFSVPTLIGDTSFDTSFLLKDPDIVSKTIIKDPENNLQLKFWQETGQNGFNFLQVYIPKTRDAIAIEPMTCGIDVLNNHKGLIILQPGQEFKGSFGLNLIA
ncbi:MAG: aldose 1-epimerase [Candidatus Cyclobacteriaceae bacterium M3_2C_046]